MTEVCFYHNAPDRLLQVACVLAAGPRQRAADRGVRPDGGTRAAVRPDAVDPQPLAFSCPT